MNGISGYQVLGYTLSDLKELKGIVVISETDKEFLRLCCSDLTYEQIADKMHKSKRTVDGYASKLLKRVGVKSRQGLVMWAIKNNLYKL